MAYRRRFRRFRRYARSYGGRAYGGFKRASGNKWITFGAGAAAGFMAPKVIPMQDEIALVITAAPVKMPRAVRSIASGYVIGRILKNLLGGSTSGTNSTWY